MISACLSSTRKALGSVSTANQEKTETLFLVLLSAEEKMHR